jgi:hypothetical protein
MASQKALVRLQSALLTTGLVQPVDTESGPGYVELLCRPVPGQDRTWLQAVEALLRGAAGIEGADLRVGVRFVLRDDRFLKGVFLRLACKPAKALEVAADQIADLLVPFKATLVAAEETPQSMAYCPPTRALPRQAAVEPAEEEENPKVRELLREHTRAYPREALSFGPDPKAPAGFTPRVRVIPIKDGTAYEIALPHMYDDLNRPTEKGKGGYSMAEFGNAFSRLHGKALPGGIV